VKILKVHNLSKVYGKGDTQIEALDDISFNVEKGEFVAIVGPSGSGKSTLLHIMGGVDTPRAARSRRASRSTCAPAR
jgi:putative ABC transport system ATP-binding protein